MAEADISMLHHEVISGTGKNDPAPDNVIQYDYFFPTPSSLTFGSHGVDPWRQSGNFPVGRSKLKMTMIPRIQHMSHLNFFVKFYFMEYIKYLVTPETNKRLKSDMNLSEYFCVIACNLIMACYVGHSVREFFLKYPITPQKCDPIRLNHIISRTCLEKITQVMSYTNLAIPEFNDPFFQHRQTQEGRNKNMAAHFYP